MSDVLEVESRGIKFNVRIVNEGDNYGLNNCLTHDKKGALVEFYDTRYPHTQYGQFVSRYNIETILNIQHDVGLDLDGGIPAWKINGSAMNDVVAWLSLKNTTQNTNVKKNKM